MNAQFKDFWTWLATNTQDFQTLGQMLNAENAEVAEDDALLESEMENAIQEAKNEEICPHPADGHVADGYVRVVVCGATAGVVTTRRGKSMKFTKQTAEATWHRFHGLRQASYRAEVKGIKLRRPLVHQMTSAYVLPKQMSHPLPQNWMDCPAPLPAPCFIAAAIRYYCMHHPHATTLFPLA